MRDLLIHMVTVLIVTVLFALFPTATAQTDTAENERSVHCAIDNRSFREGEYLLYKVYYNWGLLWIPAGTVHFSVREDSNYWYLTAIGKTYASYEWFFKVYDEFKAVVDKRTLLPLRFERHVQEGDYRIDEIVVFDHQTNTAHNTVTKNGVKTTGSYPLVGCVSDVLSILYRLRNQEISTIRRRGGLPIKVFLEDGVYDVRVYYRGMEVKDSYYQGKFRTHKITPQLIAGSIFNEGDEMYVWVSDDANRIPVVIESPIKVGSVKAYLIDYKNLRHPLYSRL